MGLTVTLTNGRTGGPVAHRAIQIQFWNPPGGNLDVITDENGQFTIDEKYRNINFTLDPKYMESGEIGTDMHIGGWQNWASDTLNIPTMLSSGIEPRSLGAGITVALKIPSRNIMVYDPGYDSHPHPLNERGTCVNIPNPMEITMQIMGPCDDLKVTTDRNGLFLIDEKYRNLEFFISEPSQMHSGWVKLDNNYVEILVDIVSRKWLALEQ